MGHSVSYDMTAGIVAITYRGQVTLAAIIEGASEAAVVMKRKNCFRVLIDARESDLTLSTLEIYNLPRELSARLTELGVNIHRIRRALVVTKDINDHLFIETTTKNVEQNTCVFLELDEAKQWLSE